jgi:hypothetical protein
MRRLWLLAAVLAVLAAEPRSASAASMPARDAAAFRDSVGVNTHITYYDTAYGDWPRVVAKLEELGVDHLREGIYANPAWGPWNERYYRAVELAAAHGLRFSVLMGEPGYRAGTLDELIAIAAGRLRHAIDGIEGPNEYDNFHGGPNWPSEVRSYQQELYAKVRVNPALSAVPVIAPTVVKRESADRLGSLEDFVDAGNFHPYAGGLAPAPEHLRRESEHAAKISGSKPLYATEAGFHNALNATAGQPPVSEAVGASYLLRTYLEHFRAGVRRTYAYELIDEKPDAGLLDPEQHFGLLRNDYSEKPAFVALKNLLQLVGRPAPVPSPEPLALDLRGDTAGLQQLLLQRAAGAYTLILWRAESEWDRLARTPLTARSAPVAVGLPAGATASAARPTLSAALAPVSDSVTVGADPVVMQIVVPSPAAPAPAPTPTPTLAPRPSPDVSCRGLAGGRPRLSARIRGRRSHGRRVRVAVCATRAGALRLELRSAPRRGLGSGRVVARRRVRLRAGRPAVITLRSRVRLARTSSPRSVRLHARYRPRGAGRVVRLERRVRASAQR